MHRVAAVVQIPCPWIRSDEREYRRQPQPHSPLFPCVIPDHVMTRKPAAPQPSLFCSPHLVLSLSSHPHPRSPSPLSIPAFITHPHPHRSSLPSSSAITNARCQHTGIYASPSSHLCVLRHLRTWPLSLSLSLFAPGNFPELSTQAPFCITV